MRKYIKRIFFTLPVAGTLLAARTRVFAHGVDELPGPGRDITVILSVVWIIIALGVVFLIRRLLRRDTEKFRGPSGGDVSNTKEP